MISIRCCKRYHIVLFILFCLIQRSLCCGKPEITPRSLETRGRIAGGEAAIPNSWPWMASMYIYRLDTNYCGGALIDSKWVLSAAHCFESYSNPVYWQVRLGRHFTDSTNNPHEKIIGVSNILVHPYYNSRLNRNDIALVELEQPVEFNDYISPICLPERSTNYSIFDYCGVTGWGITKGTGYNNELKQVLAPIIDQDICNGEDMYDGGLTQSMLCAGFAGTNIGSCRGDSGGPLQCLVEDEWYLAGITSGGLGCDSTEAVPVYSKVAKFMNWITNIISAAASD